MPQRGILCVTCNDEDTDKMKLFQVEYDWATYEDMDNADGMQFDTLYEEMQRVIPEPWIIADAPELIDSEKVATEKAHVGVARLFVPKPKENKDKHRQKKVDL